MIKRLGIILIVFLIWQTLVGCIAPDISDPQERILEPDDEIEQITPEEPGKNPVLEKMQLGELPEGTLAVMLNYPDERELDQIKIYETYSHDTSGEKLLLIPVFQNSQVEIARVSYTDSGTFIKEKTLCTSKTGNEEYGLLIEAIRPEGLPELAFWVTHDGMTSEYLLSYNGRDGTPHLEYMKEGDQMNQRSLFLEGQPFRHDEISQIFFMGEADVLELYGQPEKSTEIPFLEGVKAVEFYYPNAIFQLAYGENQEDATVFYARITDDRIRAPRDIMIGDTQEQVLKKFLREKEEIHHVYDKESNRSYILLYGSYEYMADGGIMDFANDIPIAITYLHEGVSVTFELKEGRVSGVCYAVSIL